MDIEDIQQLQVSRETKIVLLVIDGLGGLPRHADGKTELEAAATPNLDALAAQSICGLQEPVGAGITPGSGPGHLALFGYDPLRYRIGRGVLSALGVNFELRPEDIAARGNFCTVDDSGLVTDRRAGRIATDKNKELCTLLRKIQLSDADLFIETIKEHRFLFVLRAKNLSGRINDTDPQETGRRPLEPSSPDSQATGTVALISEFLQQAAQILKKENPANMVLLRGFSKLPDWPSFKTVYGLNAAAIAKYPMYRGIARLLHMQVLEAEEDMLDKIRTLREHWGKYDFFFLHLKGTDSAGEDGDFSRKADEIMKLDQLIPQICSLKPDVIVITGDHSTPSALAAHSWHPVPVLLRSQHCRPDRVSRFGERDCLAGALGVRLPAQDLMALAMANARRLSKFGA